MIWNIIDRRKRPYRWRVVTAIIEATWHDDSCPDSDTPRRCEPKTKWSTTSGKVSACATPSCGRTTRAALSRSICTTRATARGRQRRTNFRHDCFEGQGAQSLSVPNWTPFTSVALKPSRAYHLRYELDQRQMVRLPAALGAAHDHSRGCGGSPQALNICTVTSFPPDEALLKDATAWAGSPPKKNSDGVLIFALPDRRSVLGIPPPGDSSLATFMSKPSD
jgi:hypothetical protein